MRHLWSLLAGVVAAPLTWCLVALGQNGSQEQVGDWVGTRRWDTVDLIEPAVYLVVAGIVIGLIATLRISPVGPLVGGLLLVAAYVGLFIAPLDVRDAVPDTWEIQDRHIQLLVPLDNGTLALIGVLLVMAVFSADRWRRGASPAAVAAPGAGPLATPGASLGTPDAQPSPSGTSGDPAAAPTPASTEEPATTPEKTAQPATVATADAKAEPATAAATADRATAPATANSESPTESPWSAPPGQSRPEKS